MSIVITALSLADHKLPSDLPMHASSTSTQGTPHQTQWATNFHVPVKLAAPLQKVLMTGGTPDPSERRQLVQNIMDEVLRLKGRPRKMELRINAEQWVSEFPNAFDGEVSAAAGLEQQLIARRDRTTHSLGI